MTNRSKRVNALLADLTTAEKAQLLTGDGIWTTRDIERLGIPSMTVTDGPNGARGGGLMGTGTPTACIPAGSTLGATWDPSLLERLGELLGDESIAKGANVLLAPTINLHRNVLGGRNFECYSEDPILTAELATSFVKGVQSKGVATTPKHFVGNDSEFERNSIDTQVDERTLRELYLVPFERAVRDGEAWGLMSAYNRLNGVFCSENEWLLTSVLREQWGFDGFVVTDWFGMRSTAESLAAGTSLEMPGPGNFYGEKLIAAEQDDLVETEQLDAMAADVLTVLERTGAFDGVGGDEEMPLDRPEDRQLIRAAAAAGTVLITNNGLLPLDVSSIKSIAVIGPNAITAKVMGGGSATVRAYRASSPLEAITARLDDDIVVKSALGCTIDRSIPTLARPVLDGPMTLELFNGHHYEGEVVATDSSSTATMVFFGQPAPKVNPEAFSARLSGTFTAPADGLHRFSMIESGRARVLLDGKVIIDGTEGDIPRGDDYFGFASVEIPGEVELVKGGQHQLVVEYSNRDAILLGGVRLGMEVLAERDLLGEAATVAANADVAIVVVGTNDDWETEGRDRDQFALPGDQPELIRRVTAANPNTVVVLNTGGPHAMDWLDLPAATLSVGFAGQELGDSLVDVLLGVVDPGGRMPTTIPQRIEHAASYLNYPGENSVVKYGEGLYIGHRWFDARHIAPAVPFGHGLSYASFSWSEPRISGGSDPSVNEPVVVEVDVTNTSDRAGSDVVQLYIEPPESVLHRPVRELKGFAKVALDPGESTVARIELDRRAFAYYDPADQVYASLQRDDAPVPAAGSERHTEPGWYVEPGCYRLVVARSAADHVATVEHVIEGNEFSFAP